VEVFALPTLPPIARRRKFRLTRVKIFVEYFLDFPNSFPVSGWGITCSLNTQRVIPDSVPSALPTLRGDWIKNGATEEERRRRRRNEERRREVVLGLFLFSFRNTHHTTLRFSSLITSNSSKHLHITHHFSIHNSFRGFYSLSLSSLSLSLFLSPSSTLLSCAFCFEKGKMDSPPRRLIVGEFLFFLFSLLLLLLPLPLPSPSPSFFSACTTYSHFSFPS
jgi:hypothetical protein